MSPQTIQSELDQMGAQPGVRGCALVDPTTGMIWLASDNAQVELPIWEAAMDYWRLHQRHESLFAELGDLRAAVLYHGGGPLVLLPCTSEPELLLVAHGGSQSVDWRGWQGRVRELGRMIRSAR